MNPSTRSADDRSGPDNLIRNPLDSDERDPSRDRPRTDKHQGHDPGPNLITNPLDKPGADDKLIDNPLDKR